MDPSFVKIPPLRDLTIDNITENVILINSLCEDARMKYVLERLVTHLHDFARETRLSFDEWMAGIKFLTETGQICTDVRQVCIFSSLVVAIAALKKYFTERYSSFGRNSSSSPTSSAFRCSSTQSITPNPQIPPKVPSSAPSTRTKHHKCRMATPCLKTPTASRCWSYATSKTGPASPSRA